MKRMTYLNLLACIATVAVCSLFFTDTLEFNRELILSGETWRFFTAHIVHSSGWHLINNLIALGVICCYFRAYVQIRELLIFSLICGSLISVGLLFFYPYILWYNGLSGVLHALAAHLALRSTLDGQKSALIWLAIIWLKVMIETGLSAAGWTTSIDGTLVITQAHLLGLGAGILYTLTSRGALKQRELFTTSA